MIRRTRRSLPWLGAIAALLLLALPVQADDIEPEPYVEEELEPEPEPEVEAEEEIEPASESNSMVLKVIDVVIVRPLYFSRLVVGLPFFVFWPLTLGSGWSEDVVTQLWTEPYEATFERSLGAPLGDY